MKKNTIKSLPSLIASALPLLMCSAYAADGIWAVTSSGLWSSPGNWNGGVVADSSGATADLNSVNTHGRPGREPRFRAHHR